MTDDTQQKIDALKAEERDRIAAMRAEEKERKKTEAAEAKQRQRDEKLEMIAAAASEFVAKHDLRYSIKHGLYLLKSSNGWIFAKKASLIESIPAWCDDMNAQLKAIMEEDGRMYNDVTITFNPNLPADIFNMLDRSRWLKPTHGEKHHWMFDALMQALGSDKPENIDHLKRVIAYKFAQPECYTLPVLVFWGEGGTGKNLLVQCVLKTAFDGAAEAMGSDKVFGNFNSLLKAMAAVLIDEAVDTKVDGNAAKALFQSPTIKINEKGIIEYVVDNTPLYFIASNKNGGGGIWLDRTDADRRYSVMKCEDGLTLAFFVSLRLGVNEEEAKDWLYAEGQKIATDPAEVAKWLGNLLADYGDQKQPRALHGRDFHALSERQKPILDRLCEAVFLATDIDTREESFTHINRLDLWEAFKIVSKDDGAKGLPRRRAFYDDVESWLKANARHIKLDVSTVNFKGDGVLVRKTTNQWINTKLDNIDKVKSKSNRSDYIDAESYNVKFKGQID